MNTTKYAVFTMDVEAFTDTECVTASHEKVEVDLLDGFDEYMKILDRHGIKSTLFTVGNLAPKIADQLGRHINNGHRLALHSYKHVAPMDISVAQFREQTEKAKKLLTDLFHTTVEGFRAPCFSMDNERLSVLQELGFRYDSSHLGFLKANHTVDLDLSGFERVEDGIFRQNGFFEFEMSKQKVFGQMFPISGGGYVRLSNWDFIKTLIWQYIRHHHYYVFYLHPFEMSKQEVPVPKDLCARDRYYLRHGIGSYGQKVEQIIRMLKKCGYQFVTFEELSEIMSKQHT